MASCKWEAERRAAVYVHSILRRKEVNAPYLDTLLVRLVERALQLNQAVVARELWCNRDKRLVARLRSYGARTGEEAVAMVYDACIDLVCSCFSAPDSD